MKGEWLFTAVALKYSQCKQFKATWAFLWPGAGGLLVPAGKHILNDDAIAAEFMHVSQNYIQDAVVQTASWA